MMEDDRGKFYWWINVRCLGLKSDSTIEVNMQILSTYFFMYICNTGVYITFEINIFAPPPFLIYIYLFITGFIIMRGCTPQAKHFQSFFSFLPFGIFVYFKSIGENICILFTIWRKICISPPFFIPFQAFAFFPPNLLFGHIFAPSNRKYTPLM